MVIRIDRCVQAVREIHMSAPKPLMTMILSICMDYLQVRNAQKTIFRVRQAVREEHSRPLNLRWLWPCPSVWTTCTTVFKSSANWFAANLGPEVFLEIFLRERASEPTLLADNKSRGGGSLSLSRRKIPRKTSEKRVVRRQLTRVICSFPGIASTTTNSISSMGWCATYQLSS